MKNPLPKTIIVIFDSKGIPKAVGFNEKQAWKQLFWFSMCSVEICRLLIKQGYFSKRIKIT